MHCMLSLPFSNRMSRLHLPSIITAALLVLSFGCQTTEPKPEPVDEQVEPEVPEPSPVVTNIYVPSITAAERTPDQDDYKFLPINTVSEPMTGDPERPFNEATPDIAARLERMKFKPTTFPVEETGAGLAFSSLVAVPKLEIQELPDGRIRIQVRIYNASEKDLRLQVSCETTDDLATPEEKLVQNGILLIKQVFRDFSFIIDGPVTRKFVLTCNARAVKVKSAQ